MELHYLEIFNMVAKYSSFKKASEILHISQPAISIQVKKLEYQTNLKLFYRVGNRICLSESGIMMYNYTKRIFSIVEEMENSISSQSVIIGGTINLGGSNTPGTHILPAAIGEMKKLYPSVTFNLHIANTSEITTLIENGSLDVALNGGDCNYSNYIYVEKLIDDKLVVVASPSNKLSEKGSINLSDLLEESFVVHETTSQLYSCYKNFIDEFNIPENISMHLGSTDAIKNAVYANLGISIIPYYAVRSEVKMGMLKVLNLKQENVSYPYNLIYNKNKNLSITTQTFINVLKKYTNNQ